MNTVSFNFDAVTASSSAGRIRSDTPLRLIIIHEDGEDVFVSSTCRHVIIEETKKMIDSIGPAKFKTLLIISHCNTEAMSRGQFGYSTSWMKVRRVLAFNNLITVDIQYNFGVITFCVRRWSNTPKFHPAGNQTIRYSPPQPNQGFVPVPAITSNLVDPTVLELRNEPTLPRIVRVNRPHTGQLMRRRRRHGLPQLTLERIRIASAARISAMNPLHFGPRMRRRIMDYVINLEAVLLRMKKPVEVEEEVVARFGGIDLGSRRGRLVVDNGSTNIAPCIPGPSNRPDPASTSATSSDIKGKSVKKSTKTIRNVETTRNVHSTSTSGDAADSSNATTSPAATSHAVSEDVVPQFRILSGEPVTVDCGNGEKTVVQSRRSARMSKKASKKQLNGNGV